MPFLSTASEGVVVSVISTNGPTDKVPRIDGQVERRGGCSGHQGEAPKYAYWKKYRFCPKAPGQIDTGNIFFRKYYTEI